MATATSTTTVTPHAIGTRTDLEALSARVTGAVITPGHDDYDDARRASEYSNWANHRENAIIW